MATAKKVKAAPKAATKVSTPELYWEVNPGARGLIDAIEGGLYSSLSDIKKLVLDPDEHDLEDGDEVHVWEVKKVAVLKYKESRTLEEVK